MTYTLLMTERPYNTIVETPAYLSRAAKMLSQAERDEAVTMIATNPEAGDIIEGGGGIRKIRLATGNKGKSGGARIIYYFYDDAHPAFLLWVFAKKDQANLTAEQRAKLAKAVKTIID